MIYPSVWTGYYHEQNVEACILQLKQAGFNHSELCHDHADMLLGQGNPEHVGMQLRSFLEREGFALTQGHLRFTPTLTDPSSTDLQKRELELFLAAGICIKTAKLHFLRQLATLMLIP